MSIEMQCPRCGEEFNFPDRRQGEKARCSSCDHAFVIGEKEACPPSRSTIQEGRTSTGAVSKYWNPERSRTPADEDKPKRLGSHKVRSPNASWVEDHLPLILVCVSAVVIVGAGITGWLLWQNAEEEDRQKAGGAAGLLGPPRPGGGDPQPQPQISEATLDTLIARLENRPTTGTAWSHGDVFQELARRKDSQALPALASQLNNFFERGNAAKALRAYGPSAGKEVLPWMHHPDGGTRDTARTLLKEFNTSTDALVARSLTDVAESDATRQKLALEWLSDTPPDRARAIEVARAQERALTSKDRHAREHAMRGLKSWGSKENTPGVARLLESMAKDTFGSDLHRYAFDAVIKWKDTRAAPALVVYLGHHFNGGEAERALKLLGPGVATEVARCLNHPNPKIAQQARGILQALKVADEMLLAQVLEDCKSLEAGRKRHAADWLAQAKLIAPRQVEVARALDPLLKDRDGNVVESALRATKVWAHKENVAGLIAVVCDPAGGMHMNRRRNLAMEILAELKDIRAAEAIAGRLPDRSERAMASKTLKGFGAAAEASVWKQLEGGDVFARIEACRILQEIGTKKSVPALEQVAKDRNAGVARSARAALEAVKQRD